LRCRHSGLVMRRQFRIAVFAAISCSRRAGGWNRCSLPPLMPTMERLPVVDFGLLELAGLLRELTTVSPLLLRLVDIDLSSSNGGIGGGTRRPIAG
jgi:hypothetical protein